MSYRTVILKGDVNATQEGIASGAIVPGSLVALTSAAQDTFIVHGSAKAAASKRFAIEDNFQGDGIDDAIASGSQFRCFVAKPGDEVAALIAVGEDIAKGDLLESAGDGTLQKFTNGIPLALAKEDNVVDEYNATRICVEIL